MVYPRKWSLVSCRWSAGQGKFAGQTPVFYHCAMQPTLVVSWEADWCNATVCVVFQPSDLLHMCLFDLSDGSRWKAMSDDAIRSMCDAGVNPDWPSFPPLSASPLDSALVSNELEHELRSLVAQHRRVCFYLRYVYIVSPKRPDLCSFSIWHNVYYFCRDRPYSILS